jgi:hypothetical protein
MSVVILILGGVCAVFAVVIVRSYSCPDALCDEGANPTGVALQAVLFARTVETISAKQPQKLAELITWIPEFYVIHSS